LFGGRAAFATAAFGGRRRQRNRKGRLTASEDYDILIAFHQAISATSNIFT